MDVMDLQRNIVLLHNLPVLKWGNRWEPNQFYGIHEEVEIVLILFMDIEASQQQKQVQEQMHSIDKCAWCIMSSYFSQKRNTEMPNRSYAHLKKCINIYCNDKNVSTGNVFPS